MAGRPVPAAQSRLCSRNDSISHADRSRFEENPKRSGKNPTLRYARLRLFRSHSVMRPICVARPFFEVVLQYHAAPNSDAVPAPVRTALGHMPIVWDSGRWSAARSSLIAKARWTRTAPATYISIDRTRGSERFAHPKLAKLTARHSLGEAIAPARSSLWQRARWRLSHGRFRGAPRAAMAGRSRDAKLAP